MPSVIRHYTHRHSSKLQKQHQLYSWHPSSKHVDAARGPPTLLFGVKICTHRQCNGPEHCFVCHCYDRLLGPIQSVLPVQGSTDTHIQDLATHCPRQSACCSWQMSLSMQLCFGLSQSSGNISHRYSLQPKCLCRSFAFQMLHSRPSLDVVAQPRVGLHG